MAVSTTSSTSSSPTNVTQRTEVPPYSAEEYLADLKKVTEGRTDPELAQVMVSEAQDAMRWLHSLGLRYRLMYERQAYERPDGSFLFWGGLHVGNVDGGEGLIADHTRAAAKLGTEVRYGARATGLVVEDGRVVGVEVDDDSGSHVFRAESVILASGGFESNPDWREEHLGRGWRNAKVRGTPYNTGEMIAAALAIGAAKGGDWSTAHSVQWDAFTPDNESNRELTNRLTRQSYPLGIIVNREGRRFLDEGADFRNYTYAKYGERILKQPGSIAFQIFDATLRPMLRSEEYDMPGISVVTADSIEELGAELDIDAPQFAATIAEYNASIDTTIPLDPTVKDGRCRPRRTAEEQLGHSAGNRTVLRLPGHLRHHLHLRWAARATSTAGCLRESGDPIPGLFVCGEALGGLFSGNYPGGSGLAAGMVFGRRAGRLA